MRMRTVWVALLLALVAVGAHAQADEVFEEDDALDDFSDIEDGVAMASAPTPALQGTLHQRPVGPLAGAVDILYW